MDETYGTKKYSMDKVVLLGLFAVALLIARFIIAARSAVELSEPIKLDYAGLSVSIPTGNGWQGEKQWRYRDNTFTLSSFFDTGAGSVTAVVHCRYLLAAMRTSPDTLFEEKASAVDGAIAETGQTWIDQVAIDWAHIRKSKSLFDTFFGTAQLPNNRWFDIEVYQTTGDTDLTEEVFKLVVESLNFEANPLLEAGSEIVAEIKSIGIGRFINNADQQDFYLIKDAMGRTIGFTMDVLASRFAKAAQDEASLIDSGTDAQLNIQATSLFYTRGRFAREQATVFRSDNSFDEFVWKSETGDLAGRRGTELVLDKAGIMTVRKFGQQAEEKNYRIGPAAIPNVFGEFIFSQMLDSGRKRIFVDIIGVDGRILSTLVSRIEMEDSAIAEETAYVFRVELLNDHDFSEQLYLDDQRRILKKVLRQESIYTFERTSAENVLRQFPERADYILKKDKMFEQNR
jgi:hypothetical protein